MESSLHRQLKALYAPSDAAQEVACDGYRIDAVRRGELVEIQHGSLSAIRDKIRQLLRRHRVRVVKPIVAEKMLVKLDQQDGCEVSRRRSPKRGQRLDLFDELIYFTRVFPHNRLVLETPLVEVEEFRFPGHGRRRRRRASDYQIQDLRLVRVIQTHRYRTVADLRRLLPKSLPTPFHTGHLAQQLDVQRWIAQRIAYCMRKTGALHVVGKQGNALLYSRRKRAA